MNARTIAVDLVRVASTHAYAQKGITATIARCQSVLSQIAHLIALDVKWCVITAVAEVSVVTVCA